MTNKMSTPEIAAALRAGESLETTSRTELERIESAAANHNIEIYTTIERRNVPTYIIWSI